MQGDSDGVFESSLKIVLNQLRAVMEGDSDDTSMIVVFTGPRDPFFNPLCDQNYLDGMQIKGNPYFTEEQTELARRRWQRGYAEFRDAEEMMERNKGSI